MGYRILVDEDTHEGVASALRDRSHEPVTVDDSIGKGAKDPAVRAYAAETDRVLLICDDDFLDTEHGNDVLGLATLQYAR